MSTSHPSFRQNCCILHAGLGPSTRTLSPWECDAIRGPVLSRSPLSSFPRIGNDILCQWISGPEEQSFPTGIRPTIKKAEDFSSASFRLVPSPRYFAKSKLTAEGFRFRRRWRAKRWRSAPQHPRLNRRNVRPSCSGSTGLPSRSRSSSGWYPSLPSPIR
jgi:hypothetical protein